MQAVAYSCFTWYDVKNAIHGQISVDRRDGGMILYRPVGTKELKLIEESDYSGFPPRLPEQPIFILFSLNNTQWKLHRDGM